MKQKTRQFREIYSVPIQICRRMVAFISACVNCISSRSFHSFEMECNRFELAAHADQAV